MYLKPTATPTATPARTGHRRRSSSALRTAAHVASATGANAPTSVRARREYVTGRKAKASTAAAATPAAGSHSRRPTS